MSGAHTSIGIEAEGRRHRRKKKKSKHLLCVRWIFYIGALCKFWANDGDGGHKKGIILTSVARFETFMPKMSSPNRKFRYDFRDGKLWWMTLTTSRNQNWVPSYAWKKSFVSVDEWLISTGLCLNRRWTTKISERTTKNPFSPISLQPFLQFSHRN